MTIAEDEISAEDVNLYECSVMENVTYLIKWDTNSQNMYRIVDGLQGVVQFQYQRGEDAKNGKYEAIVYKKHGSIKAGYFETATSDLAKKLWMQNDPEFPEYYIRDESADTIEYEAMPNP